MGKLGGREIGYGSDLDVLFLFAPERAPAGVEPEAYFGRAARRMMRLIGVSHAAGPGYELDTRLRPSGSQGLLVTSVDAFARYHGAAVDADAGPASVHVRAAAWERFALLRARAAAGDRELGARAMKVAHAAAYDLPFDARGAAEEIARLRARLERENSQERHGRYDLKLGRGGLVDVEFVVQLLQLEHGKDPRVRTPDTAVAIEALAACGYLPPRRAAALRDGHAFLRKIEQRLRMIVHANAAQLLEERAPGLVPLARRMGIRAARAARRGRGAARPLPRGDVAPCARRTTRSYPAPLEAPRRPRARHQRRPQRSQRAPRRSTSSAPDAGASVTFGQARRNHRRAEALLRQTAAAISSAHERSTDTAATATGSGSAPATSSARRPTSTAYSAAATAIGRPAQNASLSPTATPTRSASEVTTSNKTEPDGHVGAVHLAEHARQRAEKHGER